MLDSLARVLRPASWRFALLHSTPYFRLIWLTQGQGRVLFGARIRGVSAGHLIYVPAHCSFVLDAAPNTTGHVLNVPGDMQNPRWPDKGLLVRSTEIWNQPQLSGLLDAIQNEQDGQRLHADRALDANFELCAVWMQRQMSRMPLSEAPTAADRVIHSFLALLETNFTNGDTMAEYAEQLSITATHLSRVCKSQLGFSAAELITQRTLHAARDQLETTGKPAKDIAHDLGFGTAAYFSRFMVNHTGMTPRQLRQQARQNANLARNTVPRSMRVISSAGPQGS